MGRLSISEMSTTELWGDTMRIDENTFPLQQIVHKIVSEHCGALDEYMSGVEDILCSGKEPPTRMLEEMLLNINSLLYWAGSGLEEATIKESMAKMIREEQYNNEYNATEGTIGDKKAVAALNSQREEIVRLCYTNAVKLYQHKIDRASEMASALKKIITHRISDEQVSRIEVR